MSRRMLVLLWLSACLLAVIALTGSPTGFASVANAPDPTATSPESCSVCHKNAGTKHQASYDELYQDAVIQVSNVAFTYLANEKQSVVSFKMTKNGAAWDAKNADSLNIYFAPYTGKSFEGAARQSLKGTVTCDGAGNCKSTLANGPDVSHTAGLIAVYGMDEQVGTLPARISQAKYTFSAMAETGGGVDYVSAANNAGCEKCHSDPFLKHGYIAAQVNNDPSTDFYTCKTCHLDNGKGGHFEWQLLANDPPLAAAVLAGDVKLTPAQEAQYAYKTTLMNDVHMSHAMEFPYPQSMANCVTCHEGKLDKVLTDANFTIETCKSCHPVTGAEGSTAAAPPLKTALPAAIHASMDLNTVDCSACHGAGKMAKGFSQIHTGYNEMIFTADGLRYSNAVTVTVDSASFDGKKLNIQFSAVEKPDLAGIDVANIAPTMLIGLYGGDTKDYIIGPHERLTDDNGDGQINSSDSRALEAAVGSKHPRISTVSAAGGKWNVTVDLSSWTDLISNGTVKRAEIGIMPALKNGAVNVALNAPSRTFDLSANKFDDKFFSPIVKVAEGCNTCHEALATTFHSPDRSGNIVVCRLCHTPMSGSSHLEMQSRSIDSYAHSIHSGQAFDVGDIDFADPVESLRYEHHIEFPYPKHGNTDCQSCHVAGTFNVPDQSKSLPSLMSASESFNGKDRNIGTVASMITGPASRACGGCHRAELINEDEAGELVSFNQHTKQGGYFIDASTTTVRKVADDILGLFK